MADLAPGPGETLDLVGDGELRLVQSETGFRFGHDALLLARFVLLSTDETDLLALELGGGCGVVSLLVAKHRPSWRVTALELQPALADRIRRNSSGNGLPIDVVEADLRAPGAVPNDRCHVVFANPPYHPAGAGRTSPEPEKAQAKQELTATLEDVVAAARRAVRSDGRVCLVYPAHGIARVVEALAASGLRPVRWRFVHPKPGAPAHVLLVEAEPASRKVAVVEPPLFLARDDGSIPDEAADWLGRGRRTW